MVMYEPTLGDQGKYYFWVGETDRDVETMVAAFVWPCKPAVFGGESQPNRGVSRSGSHNEGEYFLLCV
jgi:hypothetical protein